MASLTGNHTKKAPVKIEVIIRDYENKSKYKEAFFSWTTISELKNFIKQKNGFAKDKQRLFIKQEELIVNSTTLEDLLDDESQTQLVLKLLSQGENKKSKESIKVINEELND